MRFELSETQQLLRSSAREFFPSECPMEEVRRIMETETGFDAALWSKMSEQGWTGIIFPESCGGMGLGLVEMATALEEMGRVLVPGPFMSTVLVAGSLLDAAGTEAQKQKYLAPICAGEKKATLALLEASASWDGDAVKMEAAPEDGAFRLRGEKLFVSDAAVSDFLIAAVRAGGELLLLMVDGKSEGFCVTAMPALDCTRKLCRVQFEGVRVPQSEVLARGDHARIALDRALDVASVGLVAEMVGGMQKVLETTVEYAKTRKQFGRPIGQFQAVQHHCADMLLLTESSRSAAYYAAWALNERVREARTAVSIAKAYASDAYREVGNRGIQVHGGMGFTWENDLHLYYKRAKASELMFGDSTYHRERIAKLVIDRA